MFVTVTLNPALDKTLWVDRNLPQATLRATRSLDQAGGKGLNVARALLSLEEPAQSGRVRVVFPQGGHAGAALADLARKEGMEVASVAVQGQTRTAFTIRDAESGKYWHYLEPGPEFQDRELLPLREGFLAALAGAHTLVVSGSVPSPNAEPLIPWMVQTGLRHGLRVALDASGPHVRPAYEAGPWMAKPTLGELRLTLGEALETETEQWRALDRLSGWGTELGVLSLGAEGALAVARGEHYRIHTPQVEVVNDLGAGDSMVAGLCWAARRGYNPEECLRWGTACGAANVAVWEPGLLDRTEVERLLPQAQVTRVGTV